MGTSSHVNRKYTSEGVLEDAIQCPIYEQNAISRLQAGCTSLWQRPLGETRTFLYTCFAIDGQTASNMSNRAKIYLGSWQFW